MRLLHLHDAPHVSGGATAYLRRVAEEAAGRGHLQWAWSLDEEAHLPQLEASRAYRYPWPESAWQRRRDFHGWCEPLAADLEGWIRATAPDLIHVQNCAAFRPTVFGVLGRCGVPVLMTVHDYGLATADPAARGGAGLRGRIRAFLDRRSLARTRAEAFRAVRRFLCPTETLRRDLGLPLERAVVHRLPIEPAEAASWPAAPGPVRLFFAGSLFRSKGVDVLLQAMARARGAMTGSTLEIAGTGDQEPALRALAGELGLADRVRFLGQLDAAGMGRAYAGCHLLVLPSRVPENSPLTVLEAGARGRPAVAAGRGGVPELLAGERGWCFRSEDPEDLSSTLERAAADPAELRARGARMREWVRREFEPRRHWDALEAARRELAGAAA